MIVYGSPISPFVRKVVAYCAEKGLEIETVPVGIGDPNPDFRAASPLGKMPGFSDGDFKLADSSAIIAYLEAKHPNPVMIPAAPEDRGRTIWFDELADTVLGAAIGKIFFNRIVAPQFLKIEGDEAAALAGERDDLPKSLDYLETVVPGTDGYLIGDAISLADVAVASPFVNLAFALPDFDRSRWPRTFAWVASIHERPSYAPLIAREARIFARV